jgi:hypothetical protein
MLNIRFRAGAVGAGVGVGVASRYDSGSTSIKIMRLLVAPARQHCLQVCHFQSLASVYLCLKAQEI